MPEDAQSVANAKKAEPHLAEAAKQVAAASELFAGTSSEQRGIAADAGMVAQYCRAALLAGRGYTVPAPATVTELVPGLVGQLSTARDGFSAAQEAVGHAADLVEGPTSVGSPLRTVQEQLQQASGQCEQIADYLASTNGKLDDPAQTAQTAEQLLRGTESLSRGDLAHSLAMLDAQLGGISARGRWIEPRDVRVAMPAISGELRMSQTAVKDLAQQWEDGQELARRAGENRYGDRSPQGNLKYCAATLDEVLKHLEPISDPSVDTEANAEQATAVRLPDGFSLHQVKQALSAFETEGRPGPIAGRSPQELNGIAGLAETLGQLHQQAKLTVQCSPQDAAKFAGRVAQVKAGIEVVAQSYGQASSGNSALDPALAQARGATKLPERAPTSTAPAKSWVNDGFGFTM